MRAIGRLRLKDRFLAMTGKLDPKTRRTLGDDLGRVEANGMLLCQCTGCEMIVMLVESKIGPLRCPHCVRATLKRWGKVNVAFVPEEK